ncbi:McrB family protein [Tenacibaculum crassostreae]|uniref:McrB family protein n=1 Tax=Tenacibaculum crassostreae TaxID=502683 RepID=UPI0038931EA6
MNIFFGKISTKFEKEQINEGYYKAAKGSTWFGDIEVGDFAYIIGGDKIQLWKAREWGKHNEKECLWFDILNSNLGIKTNRFTALKLFKLTTDLIIHTSRSAKNRAFFKLEPLKQINLEEISNSDFYKNEDLYRKTIFNYGIPSDISWSEDLNFHFDNGELKILHNDFTDKNVLESFRNNLSYTGKGAVRKDKLLKEVIKVKNITDTLKFKYNQYSLRTVYDTFFCEYKVGEKYFLVGAYWDDANPRDQTERFVNEGIWENGSDGKLKNKILNIPEGTQIAIKASYVKDKTKSVMLIKARGIVNLNFNDGIGLEVDWEENFIPFEVDFTNNYRKRVNEIKNKEHVDAIWNHTYENNVPQEKMKENNYISSLNQIFYGPPGTGKTYNTVLEAAKIITGNESISYKAALEVFNNYMGNQIEFITFHQNYSYEDFIQGLRPDTGDQGVLSFYKKDGVFKKIADKALKNLKASNTEVQKKRDFSEVFEEFIAPLVEGEKNEIEIKMKKVSFFITNIKDKSIEFRKTSGGTDHTLSIKTLEEMYNEESTRNIQGLSSYYKPLLNELLGIGKLNEAEHISLKNYVIIIDEINRANISRVFGELITLIEKDKRYGGKIPLTATLPSGEKFSIPSNLYIIGTMNTADKSIALLDIALRRRFEFKPMYPDYEVENIHKAAFLKSLNDLIVKSNKGYDFTIGHAYFMCDENEAFDFENTINNKVIPLLLEYFMNDDLEVTKILNEALKLEDAKVGGWPLKLLSNGN